MSKIESLQMTPKTKVEQIISALDNQRYYVYNVSNGFSNYSQRKAQFVYKHNKVDIEWFNLCNVHMIAMGLEYTGIYDRFKSEIDAKYPEYPRLPDKLAKFFIEDSEIDKYYKKRFPSLHREFKNGDKNAYAPNELHNILSYGTNRFIDAGIITYFSTNVHWKEIIDEVIYKNKPVGISGKFSGLNHIVSLVGVAYKHLDAGSQPGQFQIPDYLIIDDPYGKTYEYNKGLSGNDIWIPFERCVDDFKPNNNKYFKYAHRFIGPNELGF